MAIATVLVSVSAGHSFLMKSCACFAAAATAARANCLCCSIDVAARCTITTLTCGLRAAKSSTCKCAFGTWRAARSRADLPSSSLMSCSLEMAMDLMSLNSSDDSIRLSPAASQARRCVTSSYPTVVFSLVALKGDHCAQTV